MRASRRLFQASVVLVLTATVYTGTLVWDVKNDAALLRASFTQLEATYAARVPENLRALALQMQQGPDQTKALELAEKFAALQPSENVREETERMSIVLIDLRKLLEHVAADPVLSTSEHFVRLQELSYGRGPGVKEVFEAYNREAFLWNTRDRSFAGRFMASTLRLENVSMIHPDGVMEEETIVSF